MTTPDHGPIAGPHANHDRLLISAHVAGDLAGRDLATSEALLAGCQECRILHADLLALAAAAHDLPAPATLAGARDFRIGPEQAVELARGGLWRRLLRPFARQGGASRPLAMAFTTLGVAGLLLAALPTMQLPMGDALRANAPEATDGRNGLQATAGPDAESPGQDTSGGAEYQPTDYYVDSGASQRPPAGAGGGVGAGPSAQPTGEKVVTGAPEVLAIEEDPAGPSPLVLLSVAFLAAGLGLLLLRMTALRLR